MTKKINPENMTKVEQKKHKEWLEWLMSHPFQPTSTIRNTESKIGRNEKCPCGSDKKHKKCCLNKVSNE